MTMTQTRKRKRKMEKVKRRTPTHVIVRGVVRRSIGISQSRSLSRKMNLICVRAAKQLRMIKNKI
jgi:hypothetical protein